MDGKASHLPSPEVRAFVGLLLSVFLPLAAGTVAMVSPPRSPLSKTSAADSAIVSLANSTLQKTGFPATASRLIAVPADRGSRLLNRVSLIEDSFPPPSIDLEASPVSSPERLGCRYRSGALSECSSVNRSQRQLNEDTDSEREGSDFDPTSSSKDTGSRGVKHKKKKLLKKWALPLLIGYKLKFLVLVPLLFATLALLVASTGFAGFFFAMFTAAIALPKHGGYGR